VTHGSFASFQRIWLNLSTSLVYVVRETCVPDGLPVFYLDIPLNDRTPPFENLGKYTSRNIYNLNFDDEIFITRM
jgi:hypothetical protein